MPIRYSDYHPDWKKISQAVRQDAGQCCEWCQVPNGAIIKRHTSGSWQQVLMVHDGHGQYIPASGVSWARLRALGLTRIVLSVSHLDRNRDNNERSNLAALCQRCHLNHDRAAQHVPNRKYGRWHRREHQLKLEL